MKGEVVLTNKRLKEFVSFIPGINQSRTDNQYVNRISRYYDQSSFESDFCFQNYIGESVEVDELENKFFLRIGDVVVNNTKQVAAIVGKINEGKILSINYTKVQFLNEDLDKRYFLFLFNVLKSVQRQKERGTQGNGMIQKIPLRSLGEIQIPYIAMEQQKMVGNAYVEMLEIQNKLKKYSELSEMLTCTILDKTIKEAK